jgi:threonine/homoserine/homoserine lactone efflux protein
MSGELLLAFVAFAIVSLFTPGPNNLMLMTSGVNFGFARTVPHVLGVVLGFGFLVLVAGLGLGALFAAVPALYTVLKVAGVLYILYLAWLIARSGPVETGERRGRPLTFIEAAAFQWVNAKGLVMALGAATTYGAVAPFPFNAALMAGLFVLFGVMSSTTWVLFGTALRGVLTDPKRAQMFNLIMAVALVASLVPVFWEGEPAAPPGDI